MFSNKQTIYGITNIKGKEIVYTWFIKNFESYNFKNDENSLDSPEFPSGLENENRWCLRFYTAQEDKEYLTLGLNLNFDDKCKKEAFIIISIVDKQGKDHMSVKNSFVVETGEITNRFFNKFVKKSYIYNKENGLLINGILTVKCKLFYINDIESSSITKSEQTRSRNFESLFENKNLTDVVLSVRDQEFQAHKCILAAQSKVFSAMFEHDMLEKNKNVVHINDIQPSVMKKLLCFLYSGKIDDNENIDELLIAADKYEVEDLKMLCEEELLKSLTVENIGTTLILADRYKAKELKRCVLQFLSLRSKEIDLNKLEIDVEKQSSLLIDIIRELS